MNKICIEYEHRIGVEIGWVSELTENGLQILSPLFDIFPMSKLDKEDF